MQKKIQDLFAREKVLRLYSKNYFQLTPSTPSVSKNQFVGYFVALFKEKNTSFFFFFYPRSHISCHCSCGQEQSRGNTSTEEKRERSEQRLGMSESSHLQSWLSSLIARMIQDSDLTRGHAPSPSPPPSSFLSILGVARRGYPV